MQLINQKQTRSIARSATYSTAQREQKTEYPEWLDRLFMRFTAIYQGRFAFSIQDPVMLELTKAEWYETLKDFDQSIIMETVADVKKLPMDFPSLQKFHEIASSKTKLRKETQQMETRKIEHQLSPEGKARISAEIARLKQTVLKR